MRKFAATILALALATTHGLLDEGGPNVQKKDAIKGGKSGSSRVREGRVGRKLNMGYITDDSIVNEPTPTPKSPAWRCRRETLQSMPSPRPQYEFRGGFGGRSASSAAPMNRTREPCRRRADYSSARRRSARKRVRPT